MRKKLLVGLVGVLVVSVFAYADDLVVQMHLVNSSGVGDAIGTVKVSSSPWGTVLSPDLNGLTPGIHGFHIHENPTCDPAEKGGKMIPGLAAGGHYDPAKIGRHEGPYGNGHLGDLPVLYVEPDGTTPLQVLSPRIKAAGLKGRSLVIHAGGDNYSDYPKKLGGGGVRVACGVVK